MNYKLEFVTDALKEWNRLDATIKGHFKKKLVKVLENPEIPASRLYGATNRYKIKLRTAGFRLVYEVRAQEVVVLVVAVGKRERQAVYKHASQR